VSLQSSQIQAQSQSLPQLEHGIAVAPIRDLNRSRSLSARPLFLPLSQRLVYAAAIILCVFAIGQCVRACATHLYKLNALLNASQIVHHDALQESTENLSLKDQIALYHSPRGVEMLARERLNLVGSKEVLVQIFSNEKTTEHPVAH
jgi:hypothetical protein